MTKEEEDESSMKSLLSMNGTGRIRQKVCEFNS